MSSPGDMADATGKEARDDSGTAGDVEQRILPAGPGAFHHRLQQGDVAVLVASDEWLDLPCKLIEYLGVMTGIAHRRYYDLLAS